MILSGVGFAVMVWASAALFGCVEEGRAPDPDQGVGGVISDAPVALAFDEPEGGSGGGKSLRIPRGGKQCRPHCGKKTCGSDGCGGVCGVCAGGETCTGGTCAPCSAPTTSAQCDDANACTQDALVTGADVCSNTCSHTAVTQCAGGDGCCPSGCTASLDSDCRAVCGDGIVQTGETCDPPGSCPTSCSSPDACTSATLAGSAATCTAACVYSAIATCRSADGCCPAGCTSSNDSDCTASSGALDCRDPSTWPSAWVTYENEVLALVNANRVAGANCRGSNMPAVSPLVMDERLREAARCHSLDMATNRIFGHVGSDGSTVIDRVYDAGYTNLLALGENIAAGQSSPASVVGAWMASTSGHCENIMSGNYEDLGVGYVYDAKSVYSRYWTQDFGKQF